MLTPAVRRTRVSRTLCLLAALAVTVALLPLAGTASAQPADPCPDDVAAAPFSDRNAISTAHRANVDCAFHNDIVEGFGDNTYRPRLQVRRDQMASFIARTLTAAGVALPAPDPVPFTDVLPTNPHFEAIQRLKAAEIIAGAPAGLPATQYGPALQTRRDQMASFLIRAVEFAVDQEIGSNSQQFDDVPSGNTHFSNVNAAALLGLARGVSATQFAPAQATLRDQMASFVVRLLRFLIAAADGPVLGLALPADCTVGGSLTATASLSIEGALVEGEDITFSTSGVATTPDEGTAATDADGQATFDFTVDGAGTLTVTAAFDDGTQTTTTSAQLTCGTTGAANTGVITAFDTGADTYTYVPDAGDGPATVTYDVDDDTFSVDGAVATAAVFEANITIGDRVTVTTNGVTDHALVNVEPPVAGVIGNINTVTTTYAVIEPVTGTQLSGFLDYDADCDLYEVGDAPVPLATFASSLSEGDVLARSEAAELETCSLTDQTVAGTVQGTTRAPADPAATFQIGNLGDSFDDSATATGTLSTTNAEFLVDPGYNQVFTVGGLPATRQEFVDALSDGDQASYTRVAGVETFSLVNAAPSTIAGVATETITPGLVADGGTLEVLSPDSSTRETVTYSAGATFIVDGVLSTEPQFEVALVPGADVSYTPADAPTSTVETVSLNGQDLTGVPEGIDTVANTYDVTNAAGGVIFTDLDYTAAVFGIVDRYFVDDAEVAIGDFETALTACAAATENPCSIRVVDGLLATEHRLTTG